MLFLSRTFVFFSLGVFPCSSWNSALDKFFRQGLLKRGQKSPLSFQVRARWMVHAHRWCMLFWRHYVTLSDRSDKDFRPSYSNDCHQQHLLIRHPSHVTGWRQALMPYFFVNFISSIHYYLKVFLMQNLLYFFLLCLCYFAEHSDDFVNYSLQFSMSARWDMTRRVGHDHYHITETFGYLEPFFGLCTSWRNVFPYKVTRNMSW